MKLVVILVALALAGDEKDLRGEWQCKSVVSDGETLKLSVVSKIRLTVTENGHTEHSGNNELAKFNYKISKGIIRFEFPGETTYFYGRYELKGDTLRICYPGPIENGFPQPPAEFSADKGSGRNLSTWERVKD
jgi:uncharacterized protein (TIGR03067 family)